MTLPILHRDRNLLVVHKPSGLAVHPGPRTPRSLEDLLPGLADQAGRPPLIVHRLDRDTSGCLCLARSPAALRAAGAAFAARQVGKAYLALLRGDVRDDQGLIDAPLLKRSTAAEGWRMVVDPAGKPARTRWRVLARAPGRTLARMEPETGRTHQLRVHAAIIARGIAGDPVYGDGEDRGGTRLHAWRLMLPAMRGEAAVEVVAPPPADLDPSAWAERA